MFNDLRESCIRSLEKQDYLLQLFLVRNCIIVYQNDNGSLLFTFLLLIFSHFIIFIFRRPACRVKQIDLSQNESLSMLPVTRLKAHFTLHLW